MVEHELAMQQVVGSILAQVKIFKYESNILLIWLVSLAFGKQPI